MRQALGRGIGALIPDTVEHGEKHGQGTVAKVPISKIRPNHLQPRRHFNAEKLNELAQSIKQNGMAQPVVVSFDAQTNSYELIAGERRLRAAELAGLTEIEAVIKNPDSDQHRLRLALVENLQREDLNPIDEALGYLRLIKEFAMTQGQVAELVGKSKVAVSNTIRLIDLPDEIQTAVQTGQLSEGHARALLQAKDPLEIMKLFRKILHEDLSVRQVEELARRSGAVGSTTGRAEPKQKAPKSADVRAAEESLRQKLGTKIEIRASKGGTKGTITLHFFNLEDFDRIVNYIVKN